MAVVFIFKYKDMDAKLTPSDVHDNTINPTPNNFGSLVVETVAAIFPEGDNTSRPILPNRAPAKPDLVSNSDGTDHSYPDARVESICITKSGSGNRLL